MPGVRWTRDGELVAGVGRVTLHDDGALEVTDVEASDAGQYRCGVDRDGDDSDNEPRWSEALSLTVVDDFTGRKLNYIRWRFNTLFIHSFFHYLFSK